MAAEELRRENASLLRRIDELKRRLNYPNAELDAKPEPDKL